MPWPIISFISISIPAFREEGDRPLPHHPHPAPLFQSPPSVRKATQYLFEKNYWLMISIPAFREEGDADARALAGILNDFNPRLP